MTSTRTLGCCLIGAAGAGDTVSDVEFEDAVEVDEGEVEIGFGLEERGGELGVASHFVFAFLTVW